MPVLYETLTCEVQAQHCMYSLFVIKTHCCYSKCFHVRTRERGKKREKPWLALILMRNECVVLLLCLFSGRCRHSCLHSRLIQYSCSVMTTLDSQSTAWASTGSGPSWPGSWLYQYSCSLPIASLLLHGTANDGLSVCCGLFHAEQGEC